MKHLTYDEISAMKGNGSTMRVVLKYFIDKGAKVYLLHEDVDEFTERYFLVEYENLKIPLRAFNLNFYSIFNSHLARSITSNKLNTYFLLKTFDIPTPDSLIYTDIEEAKSFLDKYTCVVKPANGAHGDGITVGIKGPDELKSAIQQARSVGQKVLIQQQVSGHDHRLLFIDYKFVAAVKRVPATITGDGTQSVRQIVEALNARISALWQDIRDGVTNADQTRGSISKTPLEEIAAARGDNLLDKVPAQGETVQLLDKANVSLGGQTQDVTDQVNSELTEKVAILLKQIGLPLCGVDVLSDDISSSISENKSYVIELNAAPGLRLHELPMEGQPRQVCALVAELLIEYYKSH